MFKGKKWFVALPVFALLVGICGIAQAQTPTKIGVFDPQRVTEETLEGKRVQAELSSLRDRKQQEISAKEKSISELQQQLSQQSLSLSPDRRTTLQLDIQRKLLELNTAKDLATRELQLEITAAEAMFNQKLEVVVSQVGRDEGFAAILEIGAAAWWAPSIDLTTIIIDRFDRAYRGTGE